MIITIKDQTDKDTLYIKLRETYLYSRFDVSLESLSEKRLKLFNVRLRSRKPYCGNHPGACRIGGKGRAGFWLEGADWVEFNDMLNDTLDRLEISARVESSVVVVRRGRERCVQYFQQQALGRNAVWEKIGLYADYCGEKAPASKFPQGTPGIYERIGYVVR